MERKTQSSPDEVVTKDLLEEVTSHTEKVASRSPVDTASPQLATIAEIDEENRLWLDFPALDYLLEAYTSTPVSNQDIGRECLVSFINHDLHQPIVTGLLQQPNAVAEEITIKARQQLTLECGKSHITMDQHGRVSIRGQSINSQSYGANRIKGGSVKLN